MMRFGEIETFRALMRTGTTRRAADLLALTQPAISQSLRRLEQQSGLQLFQRVRGRLIPTPEAHALMHEVERSFVGMDAIEHRLRSLRDHGTGQLELCCYPALGLGFVPRALALWQHAGARNAMPHVSLQILSSREVREQAARGLCEVGLMADEMPLHGIEHSTFADWPGVLVMASGHPLARQKLVKPSQLQEVRFIALNPEDASRQRLQAALLREGIPFRPVIHTPYGASVCELALAGMGVGLVNPMTALDYADRGLVMRRLALDVRFRALLVLGVGRPMSVTARGAVTQLRKQLAADEKRMQTLLR